MLKAKLKKGVIVPDEPLPQEWEEGACLEVGLATEPIIDIDAWVKSMDLLCAESSPDQEKAMQQAIDEHRGQAKEQMRREMGLSA